MTRKTLARIAIVMVIVFGAAILMYPTIFNPEKKSTEPIEAPPVPQAKANDP